MIIGNGLALDVTICEVSRLIQCLRAGFSVLAVGGQIRRCLSRATLQNEVGTIVIKASQHVPELQHRVFTLALG